MTETTSESVREAAIHFLRGDTSVVDFTFEFRAALREVTVERPLNQVEVDLFVGLERWEEVGWADRPAAVEMLRATSHRLVRGFGEPPPSST